MSGINLRDIPRPYITDIEDGRALLRCGAGTVPLIKSEDKALVATLSELMNQAYENGWKQSRLNSEKVL